MKKNKSVLWEWTLSYLCLLIIPFISIFVNYYTNERTLTKEYINSYELTVSNLRDNIDGLMSRTRNFYYYILNDNSFNVMRLAKTRDGSYYNNSYQLHNSLKFYCSADPSLDCAIYNIGLGHISSPMRSTDIAVYHDLLDKTITGLPAFPDWNEFMSTQYKDEFFITDTIGTHSGSPCLVYANTLTRGTTYPINIFVTIPAKEIKQMTHYLPDNTYLILQTSNSSHVHQLYGFDNTGSVDTSSIVTLDAENRIVPGTGYLSVSSNSQEGHITCHLIITREAISAALYNTRKNFVMNLCVTLILGCIGASFLLYRNYRPVSDLLRKFNVNTRKNNEFLSIAATYENLQKEYHSAHLTLQNQNQKLLNTWLLSLLKGRISQSDIQKAHHHFKISPDSQVALIGFMVPFSNHQSMEYDDLLFFAINNIFQELFEGKSFYHIEDGRFIYYLFDLKDGQENSEDNWHDYALEKLNYLCTFFNEKWNTTVIGVVSETADNLSHCKFLYRKVMETLELHNSSGDSIATDTRSLTNLESADYIKDMIEQELNSAILEGNTRAALSVSERIFSSRYSIPFATQKIYVFDAFTVIMDIISHYGSDESKQVHTLNHVSQLVEASSREELKNRFEEMLQNTCKEISHKQQTEGNKIVLGIRQYIEENYKDQNLSVSSLADALNRNPKYVSRIFKEVTGTGILDYINQFRISKAKEIMLERKYTLEEVSEMVGYVNVRAFRRAFVKITGDIPSKFVK